MKIKRIKGSRDLKAGFYLRVIVNWKGNVYIHVVQVTGKPFVDKRQFTQEKFWKAHTRNPETGYEDIAYVDDLAGENGTPVGLFHLNTKTREFFNVLKNDRIELAAYLLKVAVTPEFIEDQVSHWDHNRHYHCN